MYKNKFQPNILPVLHSVGSKPLEKWTLRVKDGCIQKILDDTIKLSAIEIISNNSSDTWINIPQPEYKTLAIKLPILVLIVKNMQKFFSFRICILDDHNWKRSFRISNFQTVTRLSDKWCTMPLVLNEGWNKIQIDLNSYTKKAFKTNYVETLELQVNASTRVRTIYFCDRIYKDEELKDEFKLFPEKKEKAKYIPSINIKKKNKTKMDKMTDKKNNINEKKEDITQETIKCEQDAKLVTNEETEEAKEVEYVNEDNISDENTTIEEINAQIVNLGSVKNVELDMEHVLYEEVTYEQYNNDEN